MVLESCSICMNYWNSHGNDMASYQYLIHDHHIPAAHSSQAHPPPPPVHNPQSHQPTHPTPHNTVSDLLSKLHHANAKAHSLKEKLDEANSKCHHLKTQLDHANAEIKKLHDQLNAVNDKAKDLQKKLDECAKGKKDLENEISKLKTDKVNLENVNKTLQNELTKKDADVKKYYADKMTAENKIESKLEPYIKALIHFMKANNITGYPTGP